MDPLIPTEEDATTRDSDNDGVADLVEIQAGQNPFDFHDAIHMPYYEIEDGVLLSVYMGEEASAVIPHTVTSIGEAAFYGCSGLTSVTIPDSVTSIGNVAFYNCSGLTSVTIPASVTNIEEYAFYGCSSLTHVDIPDSVESVADGAFCGCDGIADSDGFIIISNVLHGYSGYDSEVHIPESVTRIGVDAFAKCASLTNVTIPDSVTRIEEGVFCGCSGLTSITIPSSVTSIGDWAFEDCSGLTNVIFMGNAPTMDGSLFFGVASECCVYVRRGSTGWGVDIPGTWQGMRIEYLDVVEANGEAVEFEMSADGKTRTATVAEGTTTEDIKVIVGGVDVTKGFKVEVVGTTATVALKNPFEMPREEVGSGNVDNSAWTDNGDGNVTLNVEVVPGLYYAADSAATIEALKRPGAAEPAKAGDAVVVPKQEGEQGFYKVWVGDAPIEAE